MNKHNEIMREKYAMIIDYRKLNDNTLMMHMTY